MLVGSPLPAPWSCDCLAGMASTGRTSSMRSSTVAERRARTPAGDLLLAAGGAMQKYLRPQRGESDPSWGIRTGRHPPTGLTRLRGPCPAEPPSGPAHRQRTKSRLYALSAPNCPSAADIQGLIGAHIQGLIGADIQGHIWALTSRASSALTKPGSGHAIRAKTSRDIQSRLRAAHNRGGARAGLTSARRSASQPLVIPVRRITHRSRLASSLSRTDAGTSRTRGSSRRESMKINGIQRYARSNGAIC